jgi:hypothetical protein
MKLWTIYSDYTGTGEGRTIQALITYADNQEEAIEKFSQTFDPFWARGAEAVEGILENEVTQYLFSPNCLKSVKEMEGKANIKLFSELHFNFS